MVITLPFTANRLIAVVGTALALGLQAGPTAAAGGLTAVSAQEALQKAPIRLGLSTGAVQPRSGSGLVWTQAMWERASPWADSLTDWLPWRNAPAGPASTPIGGLAVPAYSTGATDPWTPFVALTLDTAWPQTQLRFSAQLGWAVPRAAELDVSKHSASGLLPTAHLRFGFAYRF